MTALSIGNDCRFSHIFTRQVEGLVAPGDIVWALSTSGNSNNVVEAVHVAKSMHAVVIGFTGRTGGKIKPLCDHCFCVDSESAERVQEIHQVAYHMICETVERYFAESE